ncbi:hypothetical protein L3C95_21430 [Chitinophaga filiformis]|uniref:hypothetical protein n=1 Tax=Chitinophaga filiformis TaxID=104663 RepID=UPI001F42483A|nr:hypothetical protein [Chitinophaga filiformis]MCF6405480.1 hypothetical protein [Chitinophaga filiformis]
MLANKSSQPVNIPASIARSNPNSSGISMPAVHPYQKVAADNVNKEKSPDQIQDVQRATAAEPFQLKPNKTGRPENLKSGIGNFSAQGGHPVQRVIKSKDLAGFLQEQIALQHNELRGQDTKGKAISSPPPESTSDGKPKESEVLVEDSSADVKDKGKEPEEAPSKYTTLGFEHEFAQMTDGPLQGVSHLELATSDMHMPVTDLPFVLETDAGNEVELVSPPFLFETHPDIPIPDPEEVAFVDHMLEMALRSHTRADNSTTLATFMQTFGAAYGFTFNWKVNKNDQVELAPKNMTYNTHASIHKGILKKGVYAFDKATLGNIHIGPGVKGLTGGMASEGLDDADKRELEKTGSNSTGVVISQANLATDARVIEMIRQLGTGRSDQVESYLTGLSDYFRQKLLFATFGVKREGMDKILADLEILTGQVENMYRNADSRRKRDRLKNFTTQMKKYMVSLGEADLSQGETVAVAEKLARQLADAAYDLGETYKGATLTITTPGNPDKGVEESEEEVKLEVFAQQLIHRLKTLPELGAGSPGLRMFLGMLGRTLAGQLAVPAQKKLKEAQEKRFKSSIFKSKMDKSEIGVEAALTSRVKDLDQAWVKDNIINIGTGILGPEDWQEVVKLLDKGNDFRRNLETEMPRPDPKEDKGGETFKKLTQYRGKLRSQVVDTMDTILKYITAKKLTTEHPDNSPIAPKKTLDFMAHDAAFIDPRQDTFLDSRRIQLPKHWPNHRLHVLEIRWKSTEQLRRLRTFYESGFAPQGAERYVHQPRGIGNELWQAFLHEINQVPREAVDDRPYAYGNMFANVAGENNKTTTSPSTSSSKKEESRSFALNEFDLIENDGRGDCLFHALAGRNLDPQEILLERAQIAEVRTGMGGNINRNAHAMVTALYQTGVVNDEDLRFLVEGRHAIPHNVLAAMQRIPGIYAGDEEIQQWCMHGEGNRTVFVIDTNGTLTRFDNNGPQAVPYTAINRLAVLTNGMNTSTVTLFKTSNHWRQVRTIRGVLPPVDNSSNKSEE